MRPTPLDLSNNPAIGVLTVILEGLDMARLSLCGVHVESLEQEPPGRESASLAYAFAILSQMKALEDTIRSYMLSLDPCRYEEDEDETAGADIPF